MITTLLLLNAAFAANPVQVQVAVAANTYRRPPPPHRRPPPPPYRRPAPAPVKAVQQEADTSVSITVSPLHLAYNTLEGQVEFKVADQFSLAMMGGAGGMYGVPLYEIGGQARGYVSGDYNSGINLGVEVRYGNVDLYGPTEPGLAIGPFIGGKATFNGGFTLEAQLGGQYIQGADYRAIAPIANLNLGWSF